jgi:alpha-beta hydrolase superfamily lysophospholipase
MIKSEKYFESYDNTKLYLYRWSPDTEKPEAVLHIAHGMAEHALRYNRLAEKLTAAGIEVWAADQRGHGRTACHENAPGSGGKLGHCVDKNTFAVVARDIHTINEQIFAARPQIPVFLLGHSWGSFIVQYYIEQYVNKLNIKGCILSGTRGPGDVKVKAGIPFLTLLAAFRGKRNGSELARSMADGPYNIPFKPNRTKFDWLSRDEKEVDLYVDDPLCGQLCSVGFYRDLAKGLNHIHLRKEITKVKQDMPFYVFSGSSDPVGDMGVSPTLLVNMYHALGVKDLEFVLYPGARHETLNETNRDEVMENLLTWIKKHY